MAVKITKGKIGNALTSVADNHIVAVTEDIFDEDLQLYQNEINQKTGGKICNGILGYTENPTSVGTYLKRDDENDIAVIVIKTENSVTTVEPESGMVYWVNGIGYVYNGTQFIPLGYHDTIVNGGKANSVQYETYKCGKAATKIFKKLNTGGAKYHF